MKKTTSKIQLNVRVSPLYYELLGQVIHREFIKGNEVSKAQMIEKAITLLAAEHENKSKLGLD